MRLQKNEFTSRRGRGCGRERGREKVMGNDIVAGRETGKDKERFVNVWMI